ncbi:MAG: sigma-54-dependent Fis family transcriptional regulator [Planctomycetes bacterium]|nr:sigma-54-dependent Fis family transcriptional regulator [Planctomycetota bacterium]
MPNVMVIDDDRSVVHLVREAFRDTDINVKTAASAAEGLALFEKDPIDVVLLDVVLPNESGLETFQKIHAFDAKLPIIFITASGSSDTAIEAMKMGAHDYIPKPLDLNKLRAQVEQALDSRRLMQVPVGLPNGEMEDDGSERLVGRSPAMLDVYKAVGRVASQDVTVLILGESGTGKELIARAIYHHSQRATGPFLAVNCAALTETLLESELFGHEKGAFTGADRRRIGKFEQCHGGTIFLDEVGDMSPMVQAKVLRVLQQHDFERVGGNETINSDVRIIAATNRSLDQLVGEEKFRADLFYRLNDFSITLPPLREREADLVMLLEHFLERFARQMGKDVHGFSAEALELLTHYAWPGNVRELQNVLRKALLQTTGPVIMPDALPSELRGSPKPVSGAAASESPNRDLAAFLDERLRANSHQLFAETQAMMEAYLITRVLSITHGNQSKAAQMLGITRGSLRNKIHALGISIDHVVQIEDAVAVNGAAV